jgi:hypothetical protein
MTEKLTLQTSLAFEEKVITSSPEASIDQRSTPGGLLELQDMILELADRIRTAHGNRQSVISVTYHLVVWQIVHIFHQVKQISEFELLPHSDQPEFIKITLNLDFEPEDWRQEILDKAASMQPSSLEVEDPELKTLLLQIDSPNVEERINAIKALGERYRAS